MHTIYQLPDTTTVPSVTQVLNVLNKPALVHWAWKLGIENRDYKVERNKAANIGTLTHQMIIYFLKGQTLDCSQWQHNELEKANTYFAQFLEWHKTVQLEPILIEEPLVDNTYSFGGTPDCFALLNDTSTIIDFKTSKAIYPEMFHQLAAYWQLALINKYVDNTHIPQLTILRLSPTEYETQIITNTTSVHLGIFLSCLNIYNLQQKMKHHLQPMI